MPVSVVGGRNYGTHKWLLVCGISTLRSPSGRQSSSVVRCVEGWECLCSGQSSGTVTTSEVNRERRGSKAHCRCPTAPRAAAHAGANREVGRERKGPNTFCETNQNHVAPVQSKFSSYPYGGPLGGAGISWASSSGVSPCAIFSCCFIRNELCLQSLWKSKQ